ncbi:MAG: hypothetical protein EPGJADBJ_02567 [Saprospiraceae bacterium]|nr:hypothetical protein [Saprospiraceae bacterium]
MRTVAVVRFQVLDAARTLDVGQLHVANFHCKFAYSGLTIVIVGNVFNRVCANREERTAGFAVERQHLVYIDKERRAVVRRGRRLPVDIRAALVYIVVHRHIGRTSDEDGRCNVFYRNFKSFVIRTAAFRCNNGHSPAILLRRSCKTRNFRISARSRTIGQAGASATKPIIGVIFTQRQGT